jgi:hypothetical protein
MISLMGFMLCGYVVNNGIRFLPQRKVAEEKDWYRGCPESREKPYAPDFDDDSISVISCFR